MKEYKLREYQIETEANTYTKLQKSNKVILNGCPGSGKTEISISIIKRYLDAGKRVLVLAHSTNVLKENFQARWNSYYENHPNLTICIPQSYKKAKYDLAVVDEAHENYLAMTVQSIVKDIPQHLLLTGSPAKLIYNRKFEIEVLAMEDVPREFFAKTGVELLSTCYKWSDVDYRQDGNLKQRAEISKADTEDSLDRIIDKLVERLKYKSLPAEKFNNPTILTNIRRYIFSDSGLGKTMFVCSRKTQADFVNNYLVSKGYNSKVSHSESDSDSVLFNEFKADEFDVLVVVNRGRLGYSDDNLMNIIDMSGTRCPNLIYQMFARCVRGNQSQNKLYLKLAPTGNAMHDLISVSVQMALSLMFKDIISKFNGKNMNGVFIPVFKESKPSKKGTSSKRYTQKADRPIFPEYRTDVIVELTNVRYSLSDELAVYKMAEIGQIISDIRGTYNPDWTIDRVKNFLEGKNYTNRIEIARDNFQVYKKVITDFPELISHLPAKNVKKSLDECVQIANKYETRSDFKKNEASTYGIMTKRHPDELDKIFPKVLTRKKTLSQLLQIVKTCSTRLELKRKYGATYNIMLKRHKKELDELLPPDPSKVRNKKKTI